MTERTTRHVTTTALDDGVLLVRVSGALDAGSHRSAAAEFDAFFETRPASIVLDLRDVDFMGSAGIALLVNARHRAGRLGIPFAVAADNHAVLRPLRVSQVDGALGLHPTVDEAIAAVRLMST